MMHLGRKNIILQYIWYRNIVLLGEKLEISSVMLTKKRLQYTAQILWSSLRVQVGAWWHKHTHTHRHCYFSRWQTDDSGTHTLLVKDTALVNDDDIIDELTLGWMWCVCMYTVRASHHRSSHMNYWNAFGERTTMMTMTTSTLATHDNRVTDVMVVFRLKSELSAIASFSPCIWNMIKDGNLIVISVLNEPYSI